MALTDRIRDIADAVRTKSGKDELIPFTQIDEEILALDAKLPDYSGEYVVTPSFQEQVLLTEGKTTNSNVSIAPIEVVLVSNSSGGKTLSI